MPLMTTIQPPSRDLGIMVKTMLALQAENVPVLRAFACKGRTTPSETGLASPRVNESPVR
jgi:hypothetical protein